MTPTTTAFDCKGSIWSLYCKIPINYVIERRCGDILSKRIKSSKKIQRQFLQSHKCQVIVTLVGETVLNIEVLNIEDTVLNIEPYKLRSCEVM